MHRTIAAVMVSAVLAGTAGAQTSPPPGIPAASASSQATPAFSLDAALSAAGMPMAPAVATAGVSGSGASTAMPSVAAATAGVGAATAARQIARRRPNPEVQAQVENIAGTGIYKGLRSSETTVGVALPLELGAKRPARVALATARLTRAQIQTEIARADLRTVEARVRAVTPGLANDTRSATAVLDVSGTLQPGLAVRVRLLPGRGDVANAIVVPEDAVQTLEGRDVVFVRTARGFRAQTVTIGRRSNSRVEILKGLPAGSQVAMRNAFLLKAELGQGPGEEELTMIANLMALSVRARGTVLASFLVIAGLGIGQLNVLPIDAVPDITNNQVQINTVDPRLSPVETLVTYPVEIALAGIPGLESTRSVSRNGFSQVSAIFTDKTSLYFARQQVGERLRQAVETLPDGVQPQIGPVTTGLGEIAIYTVGYANPDGRGATKVAGRPGWQPDGSYLTPEGERLTDAVAKAGYLRTVQDWIVNSQLRSVTGVAGVDSIGGYAKTFVVEPDPTKLASFGTSPTASWGRRWRMRTSRSVPLISTGAAKPISSASIRACARSTRFGARSPRRAGEPRSRSARSPASVPAATCAPAPAA